MTQIRFMPIIAVLLLFVCLDISLAKDTDTEGNISVKMVILLDRSGSMNWNTGDPRGLSRAAVEFLLDQLELASPDNRAALVLFASRTEIIPEDGLTDNMDNIRNQLDAVSAIEKNSAIGLETDLELALNDALRLLGNEKGGKEIVLISDGEPQPDMRHSYSRVIDRYPFLFQKFVKAKTKKLKQKYREKINQASIENIMGAQFGALEDTGVEIYPIALSGMTSAGEELLRKMAVEITKDESAFIKIKGNNLVAALDQTVPKPETLITVHRDALKSSGRDTWETGFEVAWTLQQMRIMFLYSSPPSHDITWQLHTPQGLVTASSPGTCSYMAAKEKNGSGGKIFERIFIDNPPPGNYSISFSSTGFITPVNVIVEGRTNAYIIINAQPDPTEAGTPTDIFCRIKGGHNIVLKQGKARIIDESGHINGLIENFVAQSNNTLMGRWVPRRPGTYKIKFTGYMDNDRSQYITARRQILVKPRSAVKLQVSIPTF